MRNRKSNCDERVKSNWFFATSWTSHLWFVLTGHQICNNWLVSLNMSYPTFECNLFVRSIITLDWLYIWFFLYSVQIFMKPINYKWKKFLRVMLRISWKHGVDATNCWLYRIRSKDWIWITPCSFDKFSICFG